jgi:hypothetical protein
MTVNTSFATGNVHPFLCPSDVGYDIDSCDCEKEAYVGVGFGIYCCKNKPVLQ